MKHTGKIFLLLLAFFVCAFVQAQVQAPYKVLNVHKDGVVSQSLRLSDIDSLTVTVAAGENFATPTFVDLGLPSGIVWATTNVGARTAADYGAYFAWGEVAEKKAYTWANYKWCRGTYNTQTKYCTNSQYGLPDNKDLLDAEDDAAAVCWGEDWRLPTVEEQQELLEHCIWTWETRSNSYGETVSGYKVKSKANDKAIFLPAAGFRLDSMLYAGASGYYWNSSLYPHDQHFACCLYFAPGAQKWIDSDRRSAGRPIRAVREKED